MNTSVSFARRRQGEQTVAGMGAVFECPLGSVQTPHFSYNILGSLNLSLCQLVMFLLFHCKG